MSKKHPGKWFLSANNIYSIERFKKAIIFFITGRAVQAIANVIFLIWVVRLLSVNDYGVYVTLIGFLEFLIPLTSFGLFEASRRYIPQAVKERSGIIRILRQFITARFLITLVVSYFIWKLWPQISYALNFNRVQQDSTQIIWLFAFLLLNFRYIAEVLEALLEQKYAQLTRAAIPIGKLFVICLILLLEDELKLERLVQLEVIINAACLIAALWLMILCIKKLEDNNNKSDITESWIRFSKHMTLVGWSNACVSPGAIRLVIASTLGLSEAALFGFVQSLQQIIYRYLPMNLFINLIRPMLIAKYVEHDDPKILQYGVNILWKSNLVLLCGIAIVSALAGDEIITIASGQQFMDEGEILLLLVLVLFVISTRAILEMLMQIVECTKELQFISIIAPVILLFIWLASEYGLESMLICQIIGMVFWNMLMLKIAKSAIKGFDLNWFDGCKVVLAAQGGFVIGFILIVFFNGVDKLLFVAAAISFYFAFLYALKPISSNELTAIESGIGIRAARVLNIFVK